MFNKHLVKVIIGFCGMILFGLISLVIIDHYKTNDTEQSANAIKIAPTVEPAPVIKIQPKPVIKRHIKPKVETTH